MYFFYFYPLGLEGSRRRQPVLTLSLLAIMVVAFVWLRYFPEHFALDPRTLVFHTGNGKPWTILTAVFLHSSWWHLLGNLIYLHVFGSALEDRLGRATYLVCFLSLGIFGNAVHAMTAILGLFGQYGMGVLGASGALAGLLGFSVIRFLRVRVEVAWWLFAPLMGQNRAGRTAVPLPVAVTLWVMLQVGQGLVAAETGASVSHGAHLGGFLMGLVLAMVLGQGRLGRLEGLAQGARRAFTDGAYHAAAGKWLAYLEEVPMCPEARLELGRSLVLTGQVEEAADHFRRIFIRHLRARRVDVALEVFEEARRADLLGGYSPEILARMAHYHEKRFAFREAARIHALLHRRHAGSPEAQRALVRLVILHMGKIEDRKALRHWVAVARSRLPEGGWREFLEGELRLAGGLDAVAREDQPQQESLPLPPGS